MRISLDLEYLGALDASYCVKRVSTNLEVELQQKTYSCEVNDVEAWVDLIKRATELDKEFEKHIQSRLAKHYSDSVSLSEQAEKKSVVTRLPRLVRIAEKFGFTQKEEKAFTYIVLCFVGMTPFRLVYVSSHRFKRVGIQSEYKQNKHKSKD
jgi:hypothetical protein